MENYLESNRSGNYGDSRGIGHFGMCGVTRSISLIVVHCTATRVDADFTQKDLLRCHRARGMKMIGYHFYIRKDGFIWSTRPMDMVGAHCLGHNHDSIGIAYEGGLNARGLPADTHPARRRAGGLQANARMRWSRPFSQSCSAHRCCRGASRCACVSPSGYRTA